MIEEYDSPVGETVDGVQTYLADDGVTYCQDYLTLLIKCL